MSKTTSRWLRAACVYFILTKHFSSLDMNAASSLFTGCAARKTTDDLLDDGRCENNYDDDIIIVGVGCERGFVN